MKHALAWMAVATLAAICGGCGGGVSTKQQVPGPKPVILDSTKEDLLAKYNAMAAGVKSVNATVEMKPVAGSRYSGLIEEYHEVKAFVLAQRPSEIRVIGQAPLIGKTIFDMVSDGKTFSVWIPSKNRFLTGDVGVERVSDKPIENLRPQHLLDALLWPEIRRDEMVLFEEFNDETARYYILTVLRGGYQKEILRKVWFDRANLQVARLQEYGPKGVLLSNIQAGDWAPADSLEGRMVVQNAPLFPRSIHIDRPHDDYSLSMNFTKVSLNEEIPAERFTLEQPPGSELTRVGEESPQNQPENNPKP